MPRLVQERYYDDITYRAEGKKDSSGSLSPFTFLCISLVLALLGLVALYSASYMKAIGLSLPHYYYFARQMIVALVALAAGLLLIVVPSRIVSKAYLVILPVSLLFILFEYVSSLFPSGGFDIANPASLAIFSLIFLVSGMIDLGMTGREVVITVAFIVLLELISLFFGGLPYFILSSVILLFLLRIKDVPVSAVLLSSLFIVVTAISFAFLFPSILSPIFSSMLPVSDPSLYDASLTASKMAIADGKIAGAGLGSGLYKISELKSPESQFIFATFAEELGAVGVFFLVILFALYMLVGLRTAKRGLEKGYEKEASICYGLSLMIVLKALCNMLYVSGILPLPGILLPFFSYSLSEEVITILSTAVLYKLVFMIGRDSNEKT